MMTDLWKNRLIYMPCIVILLHLNVNPVLALNKSIKNVQDSPKTDSAPNGSPKICHFPDGFTKPCEHENPVLHMTTSEVKDLTSTTHSVKIESTTQVPQNASSTSGRTLVPSTTDANVLSVDRIIQPENLPHPNSKFNPTAGGIAAIVCLTVALLFYAGVMFWKRNAYHSREILLNDDDIGDINDEDMRHFEAACIQIDP